MSKYTDDKLANAGKRRRAMRAMRRPPPAPDPVPTLDDVVFGSDTARERAEELDLTFEHFAGSIVVPSGVTGYLVSDVEAIYADL